MEEHGIQRWLRGFPVDQFTGDGWELDLVLLEVDGEHGEECLNVVNLLEPESRTKVVEIIDNSSPEMFLAGRGTSSDWSCRGDDRRSNQGQNVEGSELNQTEQANELTEQGIIDMTVGSSAQRSSSRGELRGLKNWILCALTGVGLRGV